jgi:hypothetical protein
MTQHNLVGELSELLGLAQAVAPGTASSRVILRLRHEGERTAPAELADVVTRALALLDVLCWEALSRGDMVAFVRHCEIAAEIRLFGVCASLLAEF